MQCCQNILLTKQQHSDADDTDKTDQAGDNQDKTDQAGGDQDKLIFNFGPSKTKPERHKDSVANDVHNNLV